MSNKALASIKTFGKYLLWTAIAAVVQTLLNDLPNFDLPTWTIAPIAAGLKAAATWVATQASSSNPWGA